MLVSEQARVFQVRGLRCSMEFTVLGFKPGSVRNADRKCKAKTNFAACGQNLGAYTAKPNLPGLEDP